MLTSKPLSLQANGIMSSSDIKGILASTLYHAICVLILFLPDTKTLHITSINVPSIVDVRDVANLSCSYNIGTQKLNSVKWYKNEKEFYRYAPFLPQKNLIFPVDGIHVTKEFNCDHERCSVNLDNLSMESTGSYRCEVSGDAPEFRIVHDTSNMTVIAKPQHNPRVEGIERHYHEDDFLFGNCTSDFSFPPPILTWYINDKKADNAYLQPFQENTVDAYGFRLYQRSLEIRYRIDNQFYASSNLNREVEVSMRCVAQLQKLPSIARDTRVVFSVYSNDIDPKIQRWGSSAGSKAVIDGSSEMLLILSIFALLNYAYVQL